MVEEEPRPVKWRDRYTLSGGGTEKCHHDQRLLGATRLHLHPHPGPARTKHEYLTQN